MAFALALGLAAVGARAGGTPVVVAPNLADTWQWQLLVNGSHPLNTSYAATVYDVDLEETPRSAITALKNQGRYVVCYFSAGSYEPYRSDADEFQESDLGNPLDPPFGDERWIDIRSTNVKRIMRSRLDRAAAKGCHAVEPDNVDAWDNDNGLAITRRDQLRYNKYIAAQSHLRGLAVGLKNDLAQIPALVDHFDFAVNEQCFQYRECDRLQPFIDAGKPVFNAEYARKYRENLDGARDRMCESAQARGIHSLVLPILLNDSFRCSCDGGGEKNCPG
ncbi:MAG TPA: endo alpha-1,4 polygalactosaminidase [Nevskiaceae bacterium]|nr:endo alpha-1,4 polygalactosaminidase [Nevskiaceae bacterium]